jgi:hypothetical protein
MLAITYPRKRKKNKGSRMGHTKKNVLTVNIFKNILLQIKPVRKPIGRCCWNPPEIIINNSNRCYGHNNNNNKPFIDLKYTYYTRMAAHCKYSYD